MYAHFRFCTCSNPYIATTNKKFFELICNYYITQEEKDMFVVLGYKRETVKEISYHEKKEILRDFAIQWQLDFNRFSYSYYQLSEWQGFFEEYGKKYGLLTEFRENAIC